MDTTESGTWSKEWPKERGFYWSRDTPNDMNILLVEIQANRLTICGGNKQNVREAFEESEFLGPLSPADTEQLVRLRDWKESAMTILAQYDAVAETFSGKLGSSKMENLERGVARLRRAAEKAELLLRDFSDKVIAPRALDVANELRAALGVKEGEK